MVVLVLVVLAVFVLINAVKNKSNKKNGGLNTKYLRRWRREAEGYIGVFFAPGGGYSIVYAKYVADFIGDYSYGNDRFEVLAYTDNEEEAIKICENYRRRYILCKLRKKKYGNIDRIH